MNLSGYLKTNFNDLSDDYKAPFEVTKDKDNIEVNLAFKGYRNDTLENLNNFIEYGSNIVDNSQGKYPSALISNNFYSLQKRSNDAKVLKDIKINDVIEVKIPVNKNGKLEYKNQKIKVAGILNKDYVIDQDGGFDGVFQVILNKKDYKDITGSSNYNKISLRVKEGTDKEVIKKLEKITKDSSFVDIESKYKYRNFFTENSEKNIKTVLLSVLLTLLISSINIICIIRTNIILRINELATLRAIGMSMKKIKSMIIKESLIYGVLSILVSTMISTYDYFKFIRMVNYGHSQGLGKENVMKFTIPVTQILQFGVATLLICLVAVYISKNKIEKISIVEGLRVNE
jgi:putative ABC transport system permease protein